VLASCGRLVVLADSPWWSAVTAGSPATGLRVSWAALRHGYIPSFVAVAAKEDAKERLQEALSRRRAAAAVLAPPASLDARDYAARYPEVMFVLVGSPPVDDGIANTVQLAFDRTEAFREAGSLAASVGPVAVLLADGRPERETAAFTEGVLAVSGAAPPVTRVVGTSPNAEALRAIVGQLRDAGIAVFLYRPTSAGAILLDALASSGGCAVVEDWAAARPRPAQVLASIEEDLPAGIGSCLARGAPPVVNGPVHVVRGGAPAATAAKAAR
jgi:DNA-binding LacI/PurR family transcriptional regulator